jgi:hypothetical protein
MNLLQTATAITKNPAFQARGGQTFCNFATQLIAEAVFGTDSLNGLNANQIHDKISKEWRKVSAEDAVKFVDALLGFPGVHLASLGPEWPNLRRLCLDGPLKPRSQFTLLTPA